MCLFMFRVAEQQYLLGTRNLTAAQFLLFVHHRCARCVVYSDGDFPAKGYFELTTFGDADAELQPPPK